MKTFTPPWFAVLLICCFPFASAQSGVVQRSWVFDVFLDDRPIGTHKFFISAQPQGYKVISEAEFDVSFLMIPVYSYHHRSEEHWVNGCLNSLTSRTNDDGEQLTVELHKQQQQYELTTAQGEQILQGCLRSFSYWDLQLLNAGTLLNAQNGELVSVDLSPLGEDRLKIDDRTIASRHYRLAGQNAQGSPINIQLWYSVQGEWLALKSITEDGYQLRYQRRELNQ
jgi:hypothetical protein